MKLSGLQNEMKTGKKNCLFGFILFTRQFDQAFTTYFGRVLEYFSKDVVRFGLMLLTNQ